MKHEFSKKTKIEKCNCAERFTYKLEHTYLKGDDELTYVETNTATMPSSVKRNNGYDIKLPNSKNWYPLIRSEFK